MPASRSRHFCQALLEVTGGEVLRWATIADVAKRLGMDEREAILLAGECAEADYVQLDVKGPPYRLLPGSAILTEAGRQLLKTPAGRRPSKPRQGNHRPDPAR
jgi:hypothetical protein